jgi:hypothetical protein
MSSVASIDAVCIAGFGDDDFDQEWQFGFEFAPNPAGDVLARGILQAADLIEVIVIELRPNRFECLSDVGIIHDPAEFVVAWAGDGDFDFETVSMESAALVGFGQAGQEMRGFELEGLAEFHRRKAEIRDLEI